MACSLIHEMKPRMPGVSFEIFGYWEWRNVPVVQADISAISIRVFDIATEAQVGSTYTPAVSSVIFNTLQTDYTSEILPNGYNYLFSAGTSFLPDGEKKYRIETKVTYSDGFIDMDAYKVSTIKRYTP